MFVSLYSSSGCICICIYIYIYIYVYIYGLNAYFSDANLRRVYVYICIYMYARLFLIYKCSCKFVNVSLRCGSGYAGVLHFKIFIQTYAVMRGCVYVDDAEECVKRSMKTAIINMLIIFLSSSSPYYSVFFIIFLFCPSIFDAESCMRQLNKTSISNILSMFLSSSSHFYPVVLLSSYSAYVLLLFQPRTSHYKDYFIHGLISCLTR